MLPRMGVLTTVEEGRGRVTDRKRLKHNWSMWPWPLVQWPQNQKSFFQLSRMDVWT